MLLKTRTLIVTTLLASARAFYSRSVAAIAFKPSITKTTRLLSSSSPMPYDEEKMPFYALGANLSLQANQSNFKALLEEEELEIVLEAFCANIRGTATQQDARTILTTYGSQLNALLQDRTIRLADRAKQDGEDFVKHFLDSNPKATKTDSGLVYDETAAGTGASPTMDSTVEVHYIGTLTDGTVIDSSVDRGEMTSFGLSEVTKGWQEGLQLMKEGGKTTLVIPSHLAYGDNGMGEVVPPGATLKFEIELFKVSTSVETEDLTLPDGRTIRVPKGVKMRMIDEDEEE